MALINYVIDGYNDIMDNKSDVRVKDWFLMSSPFPTIAICLLYIYIVKVVGPKLMENRKAFDIKNVLVVYNVVQVTFNSWLFYECCTIAWRTGYSFKCQPIDYSTAPLAVKMAEFYWWYYFSKIVDFLDTFFFVLRKKFDHISNLHVIHHGCMPINTWMCVKFFPGGHSGFSGSLNIFVHIIMYTYYLFAALGPQYQKYLWWKKYLTVIQMVQFVLVMIHCFQLLFIDCNYPKGVAWWIWMHAVMFYFLFSNFYKETYKKKHLKANEKNEDEKKEQIEKPQKGVCLTSQSALYGRTNNVNSLSICYTFSEGDTLMNRTRGNGQASQLSKN